MQRFLTTIGKRRAILLALLPLLGSLGIQLALRAQQTGLWYLTRPLPLPPSEAAPLAVAWVRDLGETGLYAGMADGLVFASRYDTVTALEEATGETIWSQPIAEVSALALIDGILVVRTSRGELLGLDPASGHRLWRQAGLRASFVDNLVTSGKSGDGAWLVVYDPATGQRLWETRAAGSDLFQALAQLDNPARGLMVLARDLERLYALDSHTGQMLWSTNLEITPNDLLWVDSQYLVYKAPLFTQRQVCTIRLADGSVVWCTSSLIAEKEREWPILPAFDEDSVTLKQDRYTLAGMALDTGEIQWTFAADQRPEPITHLSFRPTELDAADGRTYVGFGDKQSVVYALDSHTGQLVWRSEALDLFDLDLLTYDRDKLFFKRFQPDEAEILVVSKDTGQLMGRLATGLSADPVMMNTGTISTEAPIGVAVADKGLLLYGDARTVPAPGVPNLSVSPNHRLLVRFAPDLDVSALAARGRNWWDEGDQLSAWFTFEIALGNNGLVPLGSPLVDACQAILKATLGDIQASAVQRDYESVLAHFTGSQVRTLFHPFARVCPGSEDLLAQGYLLAGEAFAFQAQDEFWYNYPLDNPYYRQFTRDLPDSPRATEAWKRLRLSRQIFIARLWERRMLLIFVALGMPLGFLTLSKLVKARLASNVIPTVIFFNLFVAGPLFDMTASELRALKPYLAHLGLGLWQIIGGCIMGVGFLVALVVTVLSSSSKRSTRLLVGTAVTIFWLVDSTVMLLALASMFPKPYG